MSRILLIGVLVFIWGVLSPGMLVQAQDDDNDDDSGAQPITITPQISATPTNTPTATPTFTPTAPPEITPELTPELTPTVTPDEDDDDDTRVIIIIGPVREINVNIITIYDFDIVLDPDSPILQVIRIGDILRIAGEWDDDDDFIDNDGRIIINIIIIRIVFINVDVVIDGDLIWRDPGDCSGIPGWVSRDNAEAYFIRCIDPPPPPRRHDDDDDDDDDDD
jgi:hypothetical protein